MELAITLLIVALAAAVVARRSWRLFHTGGKAGCGSGCGSCPAGGAKDSKVGKLVSLELSPLKKR
ncbi:MAG: FeoB-associated Cys-rich membrane protein [Planctomycetaceae bacterium]|nr:FeoB-associated Cys-rich membrane protein [Planctomycetaceae bacterium]